MSSPWVWEPSTRLSWLDHTPDVLADALASFCGRGYTIDDLRADVARFAFLLGGDGERLVRGDDR